MKPDITRRLGKFYIRSALLNRAPGAIMEALKGCIVIRCEHLYAMEEQEARFEYAAYAAFFESIEPCTIPPEYICTIHQLGPNKYSAEWKRKE